MEYTLTITEARSKLLGLPRKLGGKAGSGAVTITRRGKPVLALVPWNLYEAVLETLEVLGDGELMSDLRESIRQVAQGRTIPWEKAKRELGL